MVEGRRRTRPHLAAADAETQARKQGRAIELFHAAFLQVATTQLPLADFALKGGGNLRFFLRSRRRSADLDLDYIGRDFARFAERMDKVMASRALAELVRMRDITLVVEGRRARDTAMVKRWKFKLARPGMEDASSKIEFSSREPIGAPVLEQTDTELARQLGAVAVRLDHYPPVHAIEQKVNALARRSETEPRDVFDLDHLFLQYAGALDAATLEPALIRAAIERANEITYAAYRELVAEYLEEEFVPLFSSEQAWNDMVERVITRLEEKVAG